MTEKSSRSSLVMSISTHAMVLTAASRSGAGGSSREVQGQREQHHALDAPIAGATALVGETSSPRSTRRNADAGVIIDRAAATALS
ncbi:hypothetical protein [Saccharopolyspora endophytica]|uniref:Secreted protein n=1 Tax=Saccharopolyspora endophytica TaxID=543886 RepID=A0ABS5DGB0_9PSEU|nr:hypothetical protein [Saccharopolyspora endophytica]MBQ0925260.1 hypothetical protein [Saccharopolyspora endophytica]